jgi:hypothetical protein
MDKLPETLEARVQCLHQIFRPEHYFPFLASPRKGNCTVCTYDPVNNPQCSGYNPIQIKSFYVTPK